MEYQSVEEQLDERVIEIARVSKTVKGGRRLRYRVTVVVGDNNGMIGMGLYSDPPQLTNDKPRTDGVIGWLWLPKNYLQSGTDYLVV